MVGNCSIGYCLIKPVRYLRKVESILVSVSKCPEPILFSSLSPKEDENKASGYRFLEAEEAETLLEKCLAMQ